MITAQSAAVISFNSVMQNCRKFCLLLFVPEVDGVCELRLRGAWGMWPEDRRCTIRRSIMCTLARKLLRLANYGELDGRDMLQAWALKIVYSFKSKT